MKEKEEKWNNSNCKTIEKRIEGKCEKFTSFFELVIFLLMLFFNANTISLVAT